MKLYKLFESFDIDFNYFKNNGYDVIEINDMNDHSFISNIENGDAIFVQLDFIDVINEFVNPDIKLFIVLILRHEYCNEHRRTAIIENRNANHSIYFLTTHIDDNTIQNDLSLAARCLPFSTLFSKNLPRPTNERSKNYNFFNRSVNVRRLKVFELMKKEDVKLENCHYTFGNLLKRSTFGGIKTISDYYNNRKKIYDTIFDVDLDYVESFKNEFYTLEGGDIENEDSLVATRGDMLYNDINLLSLDSYFSFTIESSGDGDVDLRVTEKTVRSWICKNIFLVLQCRGFNKRLKSLGIETFEDVFGLEVDWDDCDEIDRINIFYSKLKEFNTKSTEEIKTIFFAYDIQQRLEKNYNYIKNSFDAINTSKEIEKLMGYENFILK